MSSKLKYFLPLILSAFLMADEAHDIIKKVEKNMRGESVYMKIQMQISTSKYERNIGIESWAVGNEKSFMKIIAPSRDRGITFLKLDNQLWQYVPKIERVIKIPPSMMLQSWMGSDFTNDDLMRESSLVEDYDAKIIKEEGPVVTIELTPLENAPVVWGKIISKIDRTHYTQIEDSFYDEEGKIVRIFTYEKVKKFGVYYIPTQWHIKPLDEDKKDHKTVIILDDVRFDSEINPQYFSKKALIRYSR